MTVPTPSITWPAELVEEGSPQDASIMLTGEAKIAGAMFKVVALRMHPELRMPDYREGISRSVYESEMDGMLDDIEDLVDSLEPELISLNAARYLLWMVPAAHE